MPRSIERTGLRVGAVSFIFVELVRSALGIGGGSKAEASNTAKFREYLLPVGRQVQALSQSELAELRNPGNTVPAGSPETTRNAEKLGQLAGYVQRIDLGDGRYSINYYDLDGELVSRTRLNSLMAENVFQVIPLSEPVVLDDVTFMPPDDGEWRLVPKQPQRTAELPEVPASSEVASEEIVAYVNDQDLGRGENVVSALFYTPDGRLMSQEEVDALLEKGDFIVRPVGPGASFSSGVPLPEEEVWYTVQLQGRHNDPDGQASTLDIGMPQQGPGDEGIALAMHVNVNPETNIPPDGDGDPHGGDGGIGTGDGGSGDASQQPDGDQGGLEQEGGDDKPLEVAFVDEYMLEHAANPAEAQWSALSAENQHALALFFQMRGITNLEGNTIQPADLNGDVAQEVVINGHGVFRVQIIPNGPFSFYLPQEDGSMLLITTEAEFLAAVETPAESNTMTALNTNWLEVASTNPEALLEMQLAPELEAALQNPDYIQFGYIDEEGRFVGIPLVYNPGGDEERQEFIEERNGINGYFLVQTPRTREVILNVILPEIQALFENYNSIPDALTTPPQILVISGEMEDHSGFLPVYNKNGFAVYRNYNPDTNVLQLNVVFDDEFGMYGGDVMNILGQAITYGFSSDENLKRPVDIWGQTVNSITNNPGAGLSLLTTDADISYLEANESQFPMEFPVDYSDYSVNN